ncbi:MAG: tRNA (N(6)-L-threonylcarbamoyladenosine(37)-C(2))-methylthiotransferase MtaB [Candidatus Melainabacteria bacterium]|nr:MAG: tRNA (N(6)-L-threonylcarbamoyladenosine(37)-C(2))-methylthiotransferase MtaB [Candidatus Melainabacteria bacterium]
MKKFNIHTMGCKANQFESAIIEEDLIKNGLEKVKDVKDADFYILNSCSVTHKSDNEAMYLLRAAKHKNPNVVTIATGCMAQIEKEELLKNDFIDYVVGNDEKLHLYEIINSDTKFLAKDILKLTEFSKVELIDTTKTRASLKIQDGCDNRCTYCIIWKARGKSRSADSDFIVEQINNFSKHGFKEVMLTGIHIGQWGKEFGLTLLDLLKEIEKRTTIERYRLGSLNPTEITDELLDFLSKSDKFCPHFHLSLQSANDKTLRSMNRFYKTEDYLAQIDKINDIFELPFLGSDIIAGFAGETDEDFEISRENLSKSGLTQIHTFPYSIRKGTIGASMPNQNSDEVKNRRATIIKEISKQKFKEFVNKNLGRVCEVLIEKHLDKHSGNLKGMTRNYLTVQIVSNRNDLFNTLQQVRLTEYKDGIIFGELI